MNRSTKPHVFGERCAAWIFKNSSHVLTPPFGLGSNPFSMTTRLAIPIEAIELAAVMDRAEVRAAAVIEFDAARIVDRVVTWLDASRILDGKKSVAEATQKAND